MNLPLSSTFIKAEAQRLGFFCCGLAPAEPMDAVHTQRRDAWLAEGRHGEMAYMERNEEKRRDPRLLVEGVQTIVSVAMCYNTVDPTAEAPDIPIARYARGLDYHDLVKERLHAMLATLAGEYAGLEGSRAFVDTAPVDERYWAWRAGLGWIGKNTQLIIPGAGSYFFLGELFLTLPADAYDLPQPNRCGTCTRCLQACPASALSEGGLDARRCLSYLTIEHRGATLPEGTGNQMTDTFYGCDACSTCCPWNRRAAVTHERAFYPSLALQRMQPADWQGLTREQYQQLFKGSAVKRAKYDGLVRNIQDFYAAHPPSRVGLSPTEPHE
ncbi:MAG: tRNA epoxyqueuosine(34) reductase QueG [Bacteroidaceae bacterium]|nr:tRNA epoxyqueuosine(34) reductase QueG [Bacteroidaceae bacterium]